MSETMASQRPAETAFDINTSVVHLLHRAGQCTGESFISHLTKWDLTPRQFAVLVAVAGNEGATQSSLVEVTGIDRSTMVDVVRRLITRGLLHRRRSRADTRCYIVRLTDDGHRSVDGARPRAAHVDRHILTSLHPTDRDAFVRNLEHIVRSMTKYSGDDEQARANWPVP